MIIQKIQMKNFGKFEDKEIEFNQGLNIVYGGNESGKSTIQAFIKMMLYHGSKNDYEYYLPWTTGEFGAANRLMYTLKNGQGFIVEKNFNRKTTCIYTTEPYQEVTALFPVEKKQVLFMEEQTGLNLTAFQSSIFIKQNDSKINTKGSKDLIERLMRLSQFGDENIDYNGAIERLDKIKDIIGLGNTGKHKKLIQVNQLISTLEEQKEKAYINVQKTQKIQQELSYLESQRGILNQEIKELLSIKNYKEKELFSYHRDLKLKLEQKQEKKEGLEEQLIEYKQLDFLTEEKLSVLEHNKYQIQLLNERIEEIKNKIQDKRTEKQQLSVEEQHLKNNREKSSIRSRLNREKMNQLEKQLKMNKFIGYIINILIILGSLFLGSHYSSGYFLIFAIPAVTAAFVYRYRKIQKKIQELQKLQAKLEEASLSSHNIQVIEQIMQELDIEYQQLTTKLEQCYKNIQAIMGKVDLYFSTGLDPSLKIQEITQAFYRRKDLLRQLEEIEKEIHTMNESLRLTSKTTGEFIESPSTEMDQDIKEFMLKYEINKDTSMGSIEEIINQKSQLLKNIDLQISAYNKEIEILSDAYDHPGDIEEQLEEAFSRKQYYEETLEAIETAKEFLQEARNEIQKNYIPKINASIADIISNITDKKYDHIDMKADLGITIYDDQYGNIRPDMLSNGTIDQIYFSLRIAIADMLSKKEPLPLIMDEPFAQYDDTRLKNVLQYLVKLSEERQVILFTCQKRELDLLEGIGVKYRKISL